LEPICGYDGITSVVTIVVDFLPIIYRAAYGDFHHGFSAFLLPDLFG
jgi:hypothetical protein